MRGSFFTFRIANTGMHTARANLNITAHNMANMSIPGFSRQVTVQGANPAINFRNGRGMFGTGSAVTNVIQMRDHFIDRRFWHQQGMLNEHIVKVPQLSLIQSVFNEMHSDGTGVLVSFNNFFTTLQALTATPNDPTFRLNVLNAGDTLAHMISSNAQMLQQQQRDLNGEVRAVVTEINNLGRQIANLNLQIRSFEFDGSHANDLRDQRVLLIDRLSELVNVTVDERDVSHHTGIENDRRFSVMINGYDFIHHDFIHPLELVPRTEAQRRNEMDVPGLYDVRFGHGGAPFNIHSPNLRGKLRGLIDVRDGNGGIITMQTAVSGQALVDRNMQAIRFYYSEIDRWSTMLNSLTGLQVDLTALRAAGGPLETLRDELILPGVPGDFAFELDLVFGGAIPANILAIMTNLESLMNDGFTNRPDIDQFLVYLNDLRVEIQAALSPSDFQDFWSAYGSSFVDDSFIVMRDIVRIYAQLERIPEAADAIIENLENALSQANDMLEKVQDWIAFLTVNPGHPDFPNLALYTALEAQLLLHIADIEAALDDTTGLPGLLAGVTDQTDILNILLTHINAGGLVDDVMVSFVAVEAAVSALPVGTFTDTGRTTMFRGIPFYQNRLNEMIRVFARAINEGYDIHGRPIPGAQGGHRAGYGLDGRNGRDFFSWTDIHGQVVEGVYHNLHLLNSLNFSINADLLRNPALLGAASTQVMGESDNDVIRGFLDVWNSRSLFREGSMEDFIIATSGFLSIDIQQSGRFRNNFHEMSMATVNQRAAVSDVDMNEELMNMNRFNQLFQVNARMISTMNEIYDTLINRLGIG